MRTGGQRPSLHLFVKALLELAHLLGALANQFLKMGDLPFAVKDPFLQRLELSIFGIA